MSPDRTVLRARADERQGFSDVQAGRRAVIKKLFAPSTVSTAAAGDRLAVTIEINGATEIRTYDAHTLQPAGRLKFSSEP